MLKLIKRKKANRERFLTQSAFLIDFVQYFISVYLTLF